MGFDFGGKLPLVLLALAAAAYFAYQAFNWRRVYQRKKYLIWVLLQAATLLCLLLAAAGLQVTWSGRDVTTVFVLDRSLSTEAHTQEMEAWINRQIKEHKGRHDRIAVVSFAREPMLEAAVTGQNQAIKLAAAPDPNCTSIQSALEYTRDIFPGDAQKRLVLITDGYENHGCAEQALRRLGEWGINLVVYPLARTQVRDAELTALRAPPAIHAGEIFPLEVELSANYTARGVFNLYCGTRKLEEKRLSVQPGTNRLLCPVSLDGGAGTDLKGEIVFEGDENLHNNTCTISVPVKERPIVLLIGAGSERKNMEALLPALGMAFQSRLPGEAPAEAGLLSAYDAVILLNVPYETLPAGFERAVEKCVREQGVGLLVVGGDASFAPGGYENTALEKMLPVRCRMKGNEKLPNTGLVLALDCSGSMNDESGGVRKVEMVKEAALKSVAALGREDRLGVLAFSDVQEWVVPMGEARRDEDIKERVGRLQPGGGTLILPALATAVETLETVDARVKHIILLSDGQAEKEGYEHILERIGAAQITLSTVAVGADADRNMLRRLAESGGGRSYYTTYYQDIPEIFAKETYLATKMYLNSRRFIPQQNTAGGFSAQDSLPPLLGYTGTSLREGAELVLQSDSRDPVLAFQQYGLGMVAAWTSDLSGQWSRPWIQWDGFQGYWGRILNKCLAANAYQEGLDISLRQRGCEVSISAGIEGLSSGSSFTARVFGPDGGKKEISLQEAGPGAFTGQLELDRPGSYAINFTLKKDGEVLKQARRTLHLDYSPEYSLAQAGNNNIPLGAFGRLADESVDLFSLPLERKCSVASPAAPMLIIMALIAFIGGIAVRKLM